MDSVEIWKDIDSYKGLYQISSFGRIKALEKKAGFLTKHERILIPFVKSNGYACIDLRRKGIRRKYHIHRLVAEAFIPNPNNYPCINHIDYNKLNNKVENLEWCTYSHNNTYSNCQNIGGLSRRIPVSQFDKNGKFIKTWGKCNMCG